MRKTSLRWLHCRTSLSSEPIDFDSFANLPTQAADVADLEDHFVADDLGDEKLSGAADFR